MGVISIPQFGDEDDTDTVAEESADVHIDGTVIRATRYEDGSVAVFVGNASEEDWSHMMCLEDPGHVPAALRRLAAVLDDT